MADLWNIGTKGDPIIQGQDGLPYYHAPGGWVKYGSNSLVNNNCLCSRKNYLYYVNYIHLGTQKRKIYRKPQSDSKWYLYKLSSDSKSGYAFNKNKLYCIRGYKEAGAFTTGVSLLPDLPYSKYNPDNYTRSCPQYYRQNSPFGPVTTIKRYINTYVSNDGGQEIGGGDPEHPAGELPSDSRLVWYWAQFYVSGLNTEADPFAERIPGTEGHDISIHPTNKVDLQDCHTARVTVAQNVMYSPTGEPFDFDSMAPAAVTAAQVAIQGRPCVSWVLYMMVVSCCDQPPFDSWTVVQGPQGVPQQIWGKGNGDGFQEWHETSPVVLDRGDYFIIYKWEKNENIPGAYTGTLPCSSRCSPDPQGGGGGGGDKSNSYCSSSSSCSASQCGNKPCNVMQDFPYFYLKQGSGRNEKPTFPKFSIWRKYSSHKDDPWELVSDSLQDWKVVPQWDGRWIRFHKDENQNTDYVDIIVDNLDCVGTGADRQPSVQVSADRLREIQKADPSWQFDWGDYDNTLNYWQVYFQCEGSKGSCQAPHLIYKMITGEQWDNFSQYHKICLYKWQVATHLNTFTAEQSPLPGIFVYTFHTPADIQKLCMDMETEAGVITITGTSSAPQEGQEEQSSFSLGIDLPVKKLAIRMRTCQQECVDGQATTVLSQWQLYESQQYSLDDQQNLDCAFQEIPADGWYQNSQDDDYLCKDHWEDLLPYNLTTASTDPDTGKLKPGRTYSDQPICRLYQIQGSTYGWDPVWTDDDPQEQGLYCNKKLYDPVLDQGQQDQPPEVIWEDDCIDIPQNKYGLAVYEIGPAVFPGVLFQEAGNNQYAVSGKKLFQVTEEDQVAWERAHGSTQITTGFYTVYGALPLTSDPWFNNNQVQKPSVVELARLDIPIGGTVQDCRQWSVGEDYTDSGYHTMGWRIYVVFGQFEVNAGNPCLLNNMLVDFKGIKGQNSTCQVYAGYPLQLKVYGCGCYCFGIQDNHGGNGYRLDQYQSYSTGLPDNAIYRNLSVLSPKIRTGGPHYFLWPNESLVDYTSLLDMTQYYGPRPSGFCLPSSSAIQTVFGYIKARNSQVSNCQRNYSWRQPTGRTGDPWWIFRLDVPAFQTSDSQTNQLSSALITIQKRRINTKQYARLDPANATADCRTHINNRAAADISVLDADRCGQVYAASFPYKGVYQPTGADAASAFRSVYDNNTGRYIQGYWKSARWTWSALYHQLVYLPQIRINYTYTQEGQAEVSYNISQGNYVGIRKYIRKYDSVPPDGPPTQHESNSYSEELTSVSVNISYHQAIASGDNKCAVVSGIGSCVPDNAQFKVAIDSFPAIPLDSRTSLNHTSLCCDGTCSKRILKDLPTPIAGQNQEVAIDFTISWDESTQSQPTGSNPYGWRIQTHDMGAGQFHGIWVMGPAPTSFMPPPY